MLTTHSLPHVHTPTIQCARLFTHTRSLSYSISLRLTHALTLTQVEPVPAGTELAADYGSHYRAVAADKRARAAAAASLDEPDHSLTLSEDDT